MCFASAESDSWSDFQGVHVCSLILSHMSQWKWDFFQNSSQHFNRSFHFFSMCEGGGYSKITMDTKSVSECGGYIWSCDQVVSHFFFFLFILNANYFLLMFENHMFKLWSLFLVISTRCSLLLFFCKGCVSIWIWGWSPCVHMLMLPPHLPGLVCIFCFRFSGERESFLPPPEVSPSVEETQAKWAEKSLMRNQSQILLNKLWLIWSDWFYFDREQVLRITTQSPMNSEDPLAVLRWYWPSDASLNANGSESLWRIKTAKIKSRWINRGINRFKKCNSEYMKCK